MTQIDENINIEQACENFRQSFNLLREQIGGVIVGHAAVVENVLISLFCSGHVLLEGVPGLGKTLLVRTLASAMDLKFRRIQFTPDLMPADITGLQVLVEEPGGPRHLQFQPGPIFAQVVLADEINRATPKTQSAMLEAMQEHSVTAGGARHALPEPFFVLATQNPIEQEGTYPLPEAQLDRFFFKLLIDYSGREEMAVILERTTTGQQPQAEQVIDGPSIIAAQQLVRGVAAAPHVQDYAIRLVMATHPGGPFAGQMTGRFVRFGSSPRGAQAVMLAAKVRALLAGRYHVSFDDIAAGYLPALRHRIVLNFEGQAEGITTDQVLKSLLEETPRTEGNNAMKNGK